MMVIFAVRDADILPRVLNPRGLNNFLILRPLGGSSGALGLQRHVEREGQKPTLTLSQAEYRLKLGRMTAVPPGNRKALWLVMICAAALVLLDLSVQAQTGGAAVEEQPGYVPSPSDEQLPALYQRQMVFYRTAEPAGTIIVDTADRHLYLVQGESRAIRYGIGVGREGFQWEGLQRVVRKAEWPDWVPPAEMIARQPYPRRLPTWRVELSETSGSPSNAANANVLALLVRTAARLALRSSMSFAFGGEGFARDLT